MIYQLFYTILPISECQLEYSGNQRYSWSTMFTLNYLRDGFASIIAIAFSPRCHQTEIIDMTNRELQFVINKISLKILIWIRLFTTDLKMNRTIENGDGDIKK